MLAVVGGYSYLCYSTITAPRRLQGSPVDTLRVPSDTSVDLSSRSDLPVSAELWLLSSEPS